MKENNEVVQGDNTALRAPPGEQVALRRWCRLERLERHQET